MAWYIQSDEREEPTTKDTLSRKTLLQIWWGNQELSRQAKVKRIQHHQSSFTTNAKGTSLGRKQGEGKALSSFQFSSVAQSCLTLCNPMDCSMPGFPVHHQLQAVYTNTYPLSQWCHPTISSSAIPFSSCLQSCPASGSFPMSEFFALGGQSISFSFSISPSNDYSGLISFRFHWLDLLAIQGTLKSPPQHHSWKASFFSFLYGPTLTSIHD